jgi:hypothetical protein
METQTTSTKTAAVMADAEWNAITELVIRKKGALRGRGADRKRYGDDLVHVTIRTGFSYRDVLEESQLQLRDITAESLVIQAADKGLVTKDGVPVTTQDAELAIQEMRDSLVRSLEGNNQTTTEGVFDNLVVDNETVRGVRVYKGPKDGQKKATDTPAGTIFLQGLMVLESILEPAENGPIPKPASKGPALAKRLLRKQLDVGRYVSYTLRPDEPFILKPGGTVPVTSDGHTVRFKAGEVERTFGITLD